MVRTSLTAAVTGLGRVDSGAIGLAGEEITGLPLRERRALGLATCQPDRAAEGLCLEASIAENAIAGHHRRPDLCAGGILKLGMRSAAMPRPCSTTIR